MQKILFSGFFVLIFSCGSVSTEPFTPTGIRETVPDTTFSSYVNTNAYPWLTGYTDSLSIRKRFPVPVGCTRMRCEAGGFGDWLRHLPLLPGKPEVLLFDGSEKWNQNAHAAIVNIDVGKYDLQQCADAVMRLRAEYLYSKGEFDKIHFNYTSGDRINFSDWSAGKRPIVKGNKVSFGAGNKKGTDRENFSQYLKNVFTYAGSLSLSKELKTVSLKDIQPGDIFILGGSPGHAVTVVDVALDKQGKKYFMIAQSYMPAQQIHVLKNPNDVNLSPWYSVEGLVDEIKTPEWVFTVEQLKRF